MMRKLILIAVLELPSVTLLEFDDIEKVDVFLGMCLGITSQIGVEANDHVEERNPQMATKEFYAQRF